MISSIVSRARPNVVWSSPNVQNLQLPGQGAISIPICPSSIARFSNRRRDNGIGHGADRRSLQRLGWKVSKYTQSSRAGAFPSSAHLQDAIQSFR